MGGTMIAVCGILTGAMLPGACYIFFGENEINNKSENENENKDQSRTASKQRLTLDANPALFHQIDTLFSLPTLVWLSSSLKLTPC
jgi:hypothetical protein